MVRVLEGRSQEGRLVGEELSVGIWEVEPEVVVAVGGWVSVVPGDREGQTLSRGEKQVWGEC